mgnify:FL=1
MTKEALKVLGVAMAGLLLAFALSLSFWAQHAQGQALCQGQLDTSLIPLIGTTETLPGADTALALTIPVAAKMAVARVETADVRYRTDGTVPTAAVGMLVASGTDILICGNSLAPFRVIRATGVSAGMTISYYGVR